jgi:hypothetical protein
MNSEKIYQIQPTPEGDLPSHILQTAVMYYLTPHVVPETAKIRLLDGCTFYLTH